MEIEKINKLVKELNDLSESGKDLSTAMKDTVQAATSAKKLWLEGNKSRLIKIGVSFIMFPDPTPVTPVIGASLIAAGLFQKAIQKQSLYVGDIKKTFEISLREAQLAKQSLRL